MRQGVLRIFRHGPFEERSRELQRVAGPVVQEVSAAEIELVGVGIGRVLLPQPLPLVAAQTQAQGVGELLRHLSLKGEPVGDAAIQRRSPQLRPIVDIDELGGDDKGASPLDDVAREHGLHAELPADVLRIDVSLPCNGRRCCAP